MTHANHSTIVNDGPQGDFVKSLSSVFRFEGSVHLDHKGSCVAASNAFAFGDGSQGMGHSVRIGQARVLVSSVRSRNDACGFSMKAKCRLIYLLRRELQPA